MDCTIINWNAMSEVLRITWVGFRLLLVCHLTSSWYWKVCYCSSASRWKKSWRVWGIWSSKSKLSFTIKLEYNRFRFQEWTSLVQLYVNILWGTFVIEGRCVHLDIPKEKRQWCVSTGWEVFARRVINVNFSMNMTWRRCLSVISIPSLGSVATKNVSISISTQSQKSKTVPGMTEDSVNMVQVVGTDMLDVWFVSTICVAFVQRALSANMCIPGLNFQ